MKYSTIKRLYKKDNAWARHWMTTGFTDRDLTKLLVKIDILEREKRMRHTVVLGEYFIALNQQLSFGITGLHNQTWQIRFLWFRLGKIQN